MTHARRKRAASRVRVLVSGAERGAALAEALDAVAINEHEGDVALVFVFTGQGAAYAGAVTSLLGDAAFRAAYDDAVRACGRHMDVSNLDDWGGTPQQTNYWTCLLSTSDAADE